MTPEQLKALVRTIPDFPAAGIEFRDITTLIAHREGFAATVDHLVRLAEPAAAQAVAGIEARGFIFGAAMAARMGLGFVPLRKAGNDPFGDEATEDLFYMRLLERRLVSLELTGGGDEGVAQGDRRGPVIACIDTSASMEGPPELAAKALVLAVCRKVIPRGRVRRGEEPDPKT